MLALPLTSAIYTGVVEGYAALVCATIALLPEIPHGLSVPATAGVNYFGAIATLEGLRPLLAGSYVSRAEVVASLAALKPVDQQVFDELLAYD